jgi:hypothetical protein
MVPVAATIIGDAARLFNAYIGRAGRCFLAILAVAILTDDHGTRQDEAFRSSGRGRCLMTSIVVQARISAGDRLALAQAVVSFQSLLVYDQAWTGIATTYEAGSGDHSALTAVAAAVLQQLELARQSAEWLQDYVVRTRPRELREAFLSVRPGLPEEVAELIEDLDAMFGERLGQLTELCYSTFSDSGLMQEQRLSIVEELAGLLRGEESAGDLIKNVLCAAAAGMTVGGMITTAIPPHVTGLAIAGAGAGVFTAFKCDPDDFEQLRKWRFIRH